MINIRQSFPFYCQISICLDTDSSLSRIITEKISFSIKVSFSEGVHTSQSCKKGLIVCDF